MDQQTSQPATWPRSVKRKLDDPAAGAAPRPAAEVARVEVETEVAALREAVAGNQQTIQEMSAELEAERSASASATSEAMSMILRLQREKAEAIMEARQFKRFAEEKMAHDQSELEDLEDLLFKREQLIEALSCEIQAYRHRLLSHGVAPDPDPPDNNEIDYHEYPPLRCNTSAHPDIDPNLYDDDLEKYALPDLKEIEGLEHRISQLEMSRTPTEKMVIDSLSPRQPSHSSSTMGDESEQELMNEEEFPVTVDRLSDDAGDNASDRVYTIDAVHGVPVSAADEDNCKATVKEPMGGDMNDGSGKGAVGEEGDIKKLYSRLQSLEADRESMRQAIIAMRTEKAQLGLLREIAQQLCKEVKPERRVVENPTPTANFFIVTAVKWMVSFLLWRRKASQSKYTFGLSKHNAGLLLLLDKSPKLNQLRCLMRNRIC